MWSSFRSLDGNCEMDEAVKNPRFSPVWKRIQEGTGWNNQGDLASFLDINPSSISLAKRKGVFHLEWIFRVVQHFHLSFDWLISGEGMMQRDQTGLTEEETTLLEIYSDLSDEYKDELITSLKALIDLDQDSKKLRVALLEKLRRAAG